ncbi:MAG TPA: amino acid adenylation domain-containing protein, partial [Streptosporangiaceae bacterium]
EQANRVARYLGELGVGRESLVGVCMRTSLRRLAVFIGIWKAGGAYVPLDPDLPAGRVEFMVADTGMKAIMTDDPAAWDRIAALPGGNLTEVEVSPDNAAYVIYTSGSTGQPKGVVVEHRNLVNSLHSMIGHWNVGPGTIGLAFASFSFDASLQDMFVPLLAGGTVVLAAPDTLHSPPRLAALLRDARVTFACLPPAVLNLLPEGDYPDLRTLMAAGEELPADLARRWIRPGLRLLNVYGPTEGAITAAFAELDNSTPMPPPIGLPITNCRCYVLDAHLNPVPVGVTGELHLGGAGLARGYLNRPELTAERFVLAPWGERLYKTGDLARRRPDGTIVYLGRIDNQVKIHGVRIELGEIEAALLTHPAIAQAVVRVIDGELAAYVRLNGLVGEADVREHLARILPGAMIPAHFITLDTFPLNPSGKVDKKSLPPPSRDRVTGHVEPATPTESMLAGLYATLLKAERVGATEGFFDLGGNSLTAMRLVDMISRETGADIGVTSVFLHPTPRRLGEHIDTLRDSDAGPVLPMIATAGGPGKFSTAAGAPPLFLVHAIGGTVAAYTTLSQELADTFTVYGIESPGLHGHLAPTLTDLVTDYAQRIRNVQPAGPYALAGWSMGGVIAFETARLLEQAGAEVGSLVLLDAPFAIGADWAAGAAELAGRFVADAACTTGLAVASAPDPAVAAVDEQLGWLAGQLSAGDDPAITRQLRRRFDVFSAHSRMIAGYQPAAPRVHAPALIVSALGSLNAPARERWPDLLSGPVRVECVDSDHYAFLRPPLVADVAAIIRKQWDGRADGR